MGGEQRELELTVGATKFAPLREFALFEFASVHGALGLSPGVNFTNILRAAFTHTDPKSAKKDSFIGLLGSARVKAARRMLLKLTPGVSPISEYFSQ